MRVITNGPLILTLSHQVSRSAAFDFPERLSLFLFPKSFMRIDRFSSSDRHGNSKESLLMISKLQSGVQRQSAPRSFSIKWTLQAGIFFLLSTVLAAGCVNTEKYEAEKIRGLNFQRLLAQEEKRANKLNAQLAVKDKEINELTGQLQETKDKVASLESQNRDLTVELNALKEQSRLRQEQEPVPNSPALSKDPGPSEDKPLSDTSLSDPFMSEEELMNMLDRGETK